MPGPENAALEAVLHYAIIMGMTSQTFPMLSYINPRKPYKLLSYLAAVLALITATVRVVYVLTKGLDGSWKQLDLTMDYLFIPVRIATFHLAMMRCNAFVSFPRWVMKCSIFYLVVIVLGRIGDRSIAFYSVLQTETLTSDQKKELDNLRLILKEVNLHMYMWALFIANILFATSLIRHVVRMTANQGGVQSAVYRVRDILASVVIEMIAIVYLIIDTVTDTQENSRMINLGGATDFVTVLILCNLIRFGVSIKETLKSSTKSSKENPSQQPASPPVPAKGFSSHAMRDTNVGGTATHFAQV